MDMNFPDKNHVSTIIPVIVSLLMYNSKITNTFKMIGLITNNNNGQVDVPTAAGSKVRFNVCSLFSKTKTDYFAVAHCQLKFTSTNIGYNTFH